MDKITDFLNLDNLGVIEESFISQQKELLTSIQNYRSKDSFKSSLKINRSYGETDDGEKIAELCHKFWRVQQSRNNLKSIFENAKLINNKESEKHVGYTTVI